MMAESFFQSGLGVLLVAVLGLAVGSFLNVVIYRLPIMMERDEQHYAQAVVAGCDPSEIENETFNLFYPPSACPHCKNRIRPWQNIPLLSFLLQRGRCASCGAGISPRYFVVELLTMMLSVLVVLRYPTPEALVLGLLFTWALVALFFIDADVQLLPDVITQPLLWLGLIGGLSGTFVPLNEAVIGAMAGYLSLWAVYWLFRLLFHKEGMGYGDFKLTAALCAFQGVYMLPLILLLAPLMGLIFAVGRKVGFGEQMAFGPYLAVAGWLTFMYGGSIAAFLGSNY